MIQSQFDNIEIVGISTAVPKNKEIISERFNNQFGEELVASFINTTGVYERHITLPEQTSSDLAFVAAEKLILEKEINKQDIGVCIFVTQTPDYHIPATACVLHKRLGLPKDCIAFDINLGCSGYVFGLQVVSSLMETTNCKLGILLVGDTINKRGVEGASIGPNDSSVVMLFGEGGSATILKKKEHSHKIITAYRTNGEGFKAIIKPAGGARNCRATHQRVKWADGNERSDYDLYMNGVDVFTFSITEVPRMINEFVETNEMDKEEFDCFAFHQANGYIFKQLIKRAKIPKDKLHVTLDRFGNTLVTSIPLTICDRFGEEKNGKERKIFSCGFGVGLSWGIATFTVNENDILPIIETEDYYKEGDVSHD